MNRYIVVSALVGLLVLGCAAQAVVLDFDDFPTPSQYHPGRLQSSGYGGLTWGTSMKDMESLRLSPGEWLVFDSYDHDKWATNWGGADRMWFEFANPVTFNGADFFAYGGDLSHTLVAQQVRFVDDHGNATGWFDIQLSRTFLTANFTNTTRIYVERRGNEINGQLFSMDNLTYNENAAVPEASSLLLALTGGIPAVGLVMRRRH